MLFYSDEILQRIYRRHSIEDTVCANLLKTFNREHILCQRLRRCREHYFCSQNKNSVEETFYSNGYCSIEDEFSAYSKVVCTRTPGSALLNSLCSSLEISLEIRPGL